MGSTKKCAKDIAFEKERVKFRREIKYLKSQVQERDVQIQELHSQMKSLESVISEKEDWIQRLLEYMDLDEQDVSLIIKTKAAAAESKLVEDMTHASVLNLIHAFGMFL